MNKYKQKCSLTTNKTLKFVQNWEKRKVFSLSLRDEVIQEFPQK